MSFASKTQSVRVGTSTFEITSLADDSIPPVDVQLSHQDSNTGITETNWPLFGRLWGASRVLAEWIDQSDLQGKRILEVGCGLGLASLVAHKKGFDITATDFHPNAREFLERNSQINQMTAVTYSEANWASSDTGLGVFDLIVGSDVLYDRGHPALLASFLGRHIHDSSEIFIVDPGRQAYRHFTRIMEEAGFSVTSNLVRIQAEIADKTNYHCLTYRRNKIPVS